MGLELITKLEIARKKRDKIVQEENEDDENVNVLLLSVKEQRDQDTIPGRTGLRLWSAVFIFGENVQKREVMNKKVLELGSGTGAGGLMCIKLGASEVIFTDADEKCVSLCNQNCLLNGDFNFSSRVLHWNARETFLAKGSFPVIVAIDVVYLEEHAKPLAECVEYHLCGDDGVFISCCGIRRREYLEEFVKELEKRGMKVECTSFQQGKSEEENINCTFKEVIENHKHDNELTEDGKGYRIIRAYYKNHDTLNDLISEFVCEMNTTTIATTII